MIDETWQSWWDTMHFGHDEHIMYFLHLYKVNINGPYHFWSHFCLKTETILQNVWYNIIDSTTYFKNLTAYKYGIWFYWIRNNDGQPNDILEWFRTVEIFTWSNIKVIWIYLNCNVMDYQMELLWLQIYIKIVIQPKCRVF